MEDVQLIITKQMVENELKNDLLNGEVVITGSVGVQYNKSVGYLAITDKRILYKGTGSKKETLSIGWKKISQVRSELGNWLSNSYIIVEYSGGEAEFMVNDKKDNKCIYDKCTEILLEV